MVSALEVTYYLGLMAEIEKGVYKELRGGGYERVKIPNFDPSNPQLNTVVTFPLAMKDWEDLRCASVYDKPWGGTPILNFRLKPHTVRAGTTVILGPRLILINGPPEQN
jgi:hypothetical protein